MGQEDCSQTAYWSSELKALSTEEQLESRQDSLVTLIHSHCYHFSGQSRKRRLRINSDVSVDLPSSSSPTELIHCHWIAVNMENILSVKNRRSKYFAHTNSVSSFGYGFKVWRIVWFLLIGLAADCWRRIVHLMPKPQTRIPRKFKSYSKRCVCMTVVTVSVEKCGLYPWPYDATDLESNFREAA